MGVIRRYVARHCPAPPALPTPLTRTPQNLIEKVIRERIYESTYWKEHCFATNGAAQSSMSDADTPAAETIIDKAIALKAIGGVHDRQTPTEFMCLVLRLLQLQPEKEILMEYLLAEEFKWVVFVGVLLSRAR